MSLFFSHTRPALVCAIACHCSVKGGGGPQTSTKLWRASRHAVRFFLSASCDHRPWLGPVSWFCQDPPHRPELRLDYPLNLSILVSGGIETEQDPLSNGERTGVRSHLKAQLLVARFDVSTRFQWASGCKSLGNGRHRG